MNQLPEAIRQQPIVRKVIVDVGVTLIAHAQAPVPMKPGEGVLDHPAHVPDSGWIFSPHSSMATNLRSRRSRVFDLFVSPRR
jgi:hypothetical protein